jgi:uncharacterized protein (DUF362 family)
LALEDVASRIDLGRARRVLIKPNFVNAGRQLATTHVDAVRAVLDFVRARCDAPVVIGEGAALSSTWESFAGYGYETLPKSYERVELMDLNGDETVPVQVLTRHLRPMTVKLARTAVEADLRISVCPPKTHDLVVTTLAIKNMTMGSLVNPRAVGGGGVSRKVIRRLARFLPASLYRSGLAEWGKGTILGRHGGSSKMAMHQGIPVLNLNLALVASHVWPHLAVIDGWQGMEGSGPGQGDPVEWRVALAGTDALAVDVLTTHLMGFDPARVGYLQYCRRLGLGVGTVAGIEVVGNVAPEEVRRRFEPHPTYERQLAWQLDEAEDYLGPVGGR